MLYILNEQGYQGLIEYIMNLPAMDGSMCVEVKEYKEDRTKAQNRLYWLVIGFMAKELGYTKEEMHFELGDAYLPKHKYTNKKGVERVFPKSTTQLSTKEFTEYLEKIYATGTKLNIVLPRTDNYNLAMGY
jgi:hypothetical protein